MLVLMAAQRVRVLWWRGVAHRLFTVSNHVTPVP